MIKISVNAVVVHLMVDDKATLALKLSDGTYVDFPIYDESFPLVKAGKRFRLTLEEVEMNEPDGPTPDELMPIPDEEVSEFIKPRSEYPEEFAQEYQGSFDEVSKGPFCDGCKHIGVNPESGPCAVCFEGMMYESNKGVTMENEDTLDEKPSSLVETAKELVKEMVPAPPLSDPQYNERKRKCGKCANSSNPIVCISCIKYSKFEPSRYK